MKVLTGSKVELLQGRASFATGSEYSLEVAWWYLHPLRGGEAIPEPQALPDLAESMRNSLEL